jgi:cytochrome c556
VRLYQIQLRKEEGMKKRLFIAVLSLVLCIGVGLSAVAQVKPAVLLKQRQAAMTLLGKYFGPLGAMAQDKTPFNAEMVKQNSLFLEALSKMPWDGFQEVTANEKSGALPAVFNDPAKFKKASEDMQAAVANLVAVSRTGDAPALKTAIGGVGRTCGGCHDNFREKK